MRQCKEIGISFRCYFLYHWSIPHDLRLGGISGLFARLMFHFGEGGISCLDRPEFFVLRKMYGELFAAMA